MVWKTARNLLPLHGKMIETRFHGVETPWKHASIAWKPFPRPLFQRASAQRSPNWSMNANRARTSVRNASTASAKFPSQPSAGTTR